MLLADELAVYELSGHSLHAVAKSCPVALLYVLTGQAIWLPAEHQ